MVSLACFDERLNSGAYEDKTVEPVQPAEPIELVRLVNLRAAGVASAAQLEELRVVQEAYSVAMLSFMEIQYERRVRAGVLGLQFMQDLFSAHGVEPGDTLGVALFKSSEILANQSGLRPEWAYLRRVANYFNMLHRNVFLVVKDAVPA